MRSPFNFLISTENRYNNVSDSGLILNTEITERDAVFVNRIGKVLEVPIVNPGVIKKGDDVLVHHNVFRRWLDQSGKERNSANYIDEDRYVVYHDQVFAYRRKGEWRACDGFCFVKPIPNKYSWLNGNETLLVGEMIYPDTDLEAQGISRGDIVGFTQNSEYEFEIEGVKHYRVMSHHINIKYYNDGFEEKETANTSSG